MRKWVIRFVSLLVFDILVLLLIGWLLPSVRVGWSALWAGILLTAATIWIKPLITAWFTGMAAKSAAQRTKAGEKLVQFGLVLLVAYIVWVLTVLLSGVHVHGWFWGYILPPLMLLVAWIIYDAIDDWAEGHTGRLYDRVTGVQRRTDASAAAASAPSVPTVPTPETRAAQRELNDGLTEEQRRMLDELGKS